MIVRRTFAGLLVCAVALVWAGSAFASASGVVVSEFRFRGPNGGSDEFIELLNAGSVPVEITGWKIDGCSATGPTGTRVTVTAPTTLAPGQHYLFANTSTSGGPYSGSVPPDKTYATGITDTGGLRLLTADGSLVDAAGTTATTAACREGGGVASLGTANLDQSYERKAAGTQDTDDNAADFVLRSPSDPQKFGPTGGDAAPTVASTMPAAGANDVATTANVTLTFSEDVTPTGAWYSIECGTSGAHTATVSGGPRTFTLDPDADFANDETCTVTVSAAQVTDVDLDDPPDSMASDHTFSFSTIAPTYRIYEIQGAAHLSPLVGRRVSSVPGVITVVRSNSITIQDAAGDGDPATSDAILVFGVNTSTLTVGQAVLVSGQVTEFRPGGSSSTNLTTTELTSATVTPAGPGVIVPTVVGAGGRVPPTTVIEDDASGSVETSGMFDPAADGIDFYESLEAMLLRINDAVVVGPTNAFTETWVLADNGAGASVRTTRGGIVIRPGDFNPERIQLEDTLVPIPAADVGDGFTTPVFGVLDYTFGNFELLVTNALTRVDNHLAREVTAAPRDQEIAVATFNVENLDPADSAAKFAELANLIVNNLQSPDLLALEEVQDNNGPVNDSVTDASLTYATLIAAIEAAGGPTYDFRQINPVDDQDGGEPGGNIRVGFLFRTDRGLSFVDRPGGDSTTATTVVDHPSGPRLSFSPGRVAPLDGAWASSRKPLAGEFKARGKRLFVIVNHFNSKGGDQPLFGRFQPPARSSEVQRKRQAEVLRSFVASIYAADPAANVIVLGDLNDFEFSDAVTILESAPLTTLMDTLPQSERYSYVFEGNSQSLDHIMLSPNLVRFPRTYDVVHVNAEFTEQASDHDPQVVRLRLAGRP